MRKGFLPMFINVYSAIRWKKNYSHWKCIILLGTVNSISVIVASTLIVCDNGSFIIHYIVSIRIKIYWGKWYFEENDYKRYTWPKLASGKKVCKKRNFTRKKVKWLKMILRHFRKCDLFVDRGGMLSFCPDCTLSYYTVEGWGLEWPHVPEFPRQIRNWSKCSKSRAYQFWDTET